MGAQPGARKVYLPYRIEMKMPSVARCTEILRGILDFRDAEGLGKCVLDSMTRGPRSSQPQGRSE